MHTRVPLNDEGQPEDGLTAEQVALLRRIGAVDGYLAGDDIDYCTDLTFAFPPLVVDAEEGLGRFYLTPHAVKVLTLYS